MARMLARAEPYRSARGTIDLYETARPAILACPRFADGQRPSVEHLTVEPLNCLFGVGPLVFIVVFVGFELFVGALQAYIFAVLSCLYLHDALHPHH